MRGYVCGYVVTIRHINIDETLREGVSEGKQFEELIISRLVFFTDEGGPPGGKQTHRPIDARNTEHWKYC